MQFAATNSTAISDHATSAAKGLTINVRMPDGGWLAPPAKAGERVMDLLARFGLPVRDARRGFCTRIPPAWRGRLAPPREDESAFLSGFADIR